MFCLPLIPITVRAQATRVTTDGSVTMLKEFYTAYITAVATTTDENKLLALQRKYCTGRLLKKIPDMIEKSDGDPFIKGQDSDTAFIKTLSIQKDGQKEGQFAVSYQADQKIVIHLVIVEENKKYKIDSVW